MSLQMWDYVLWLSVGLLFICANVYEYQAKPLCKWCDTRHRGRCIWNPRSGKVFANVNDGHFDFEDPNK